MFCYIRNHLIKTFRENARDTSRPITFKIATEAIMNSLSDKTVCQKCNVSARQINYPVSFLVKLFCGSRFASDHTLTA